jgi:hypothetical protein
MKALIKVLNWIEWISAVIGVLLMLLAVISSFTGAMILKFEHGVNFFHAANSFFLLAIVLFLFIHLGQFKKE